MPITTGSVPKALTGGANLPQSIPTVPGTKASDSMGAGVKQDLKGTSQHHQNVSPVLHLKKQSLGHMSNPSAYHSNKSSTAFPIK